MGGSSTDSDVVLTTGSWDGIDDVVTSETPDASTTSHSQTQDAPLPRQSGHTSSNPIKLDADATAGPALGRDNAAYKSVYLERLCVEQTPEVLEAGVEAASRLLKQLHEALGAYKSPDTEVWLSNIVKLQKRDTLPRTVIGVVGSTGAGKSSVINAVLDEERLVPTNCLRACTASPTEISYNHSDNPDELYRAEIEFISEKEWVRELETLFHDLLDANGNISHEATTTGSEANIAYMKVRAVYPRKTKDMLVQANPKVLANEPAIRGVLGSTKIIKESTPKGLYSRLQRYVDSAEKSTGSGERKKKIDVPIEYWPLIKVVRIKTKADALSTGAVIVDLPGVQDSNAARAAVADKYMQSCTGLWIVAPINRAVDDKVAKTLLGDSFKRQLKYDGSYSGISFICSKTDDISISEASESLEMEADVSESWEVAEKLERNEYQIKSQISTLQIAKAELRDQRDTCEAETEIWEELQIKMARGKKVYAPSVQSRKRKRGALADNNSDSDSDDSDTSDSESSDDDMSSSSEETRKPLTKDEIAEKLSSLRTQRKAIRKEKQPLEFEIVRLSREADNIKATRDSIMEEIKASCIKGRNDYAKAAIKNDFANGIKEMDQEYAAETDPASFDPDEDARDYGELARDLPVFCVSSRVYQNLKGRLEKDKVENHGFGSVEDTEIPELQRYAKRLTEARRTTHCRGFLNELLQLVNSMKLWSWDRGEGPSLMQSERRQEEEHLKKLLTELEEELETSLSQSIDLMWKCLEEHIFKNIDAATPMAVETATSTAYSWSAPRSQGGLAWSTFRATVRRQGVYAGVSGNRDFNQELFDPISRNLATGWDQAFQYKLPDVLRLFAKETSERLDQFHLAAKAPAETRQNNIPGLYILSKQVMTHLRTVGALPDSIQQKITELQREASRQFTPVIRELMDDGYNACMEQRGSGSYVRMKAAMAAHVEETRHSMFHKASRTVREALEALCATVKEDIAGSLHLLLEAVKQDYMRTLVGIDTGPHPNRSTNREMSVRNRVKQVILNSDKLFGPVLGEPCSGSADDDVITANRADEWMQASIRRKTLTEGAVEEYLMTEHDIKGEQE